MLTCIMHEMIEEMLMLTVVVFQVLAKWIFKIKSTLYVCLSIVFLSETVMQSHLAGKKHVALVKFKQSQQSLADRSIFVRGFPFGTTDAELKNVFSFFGNVIKVVISKEQVSTFSCTWHWLGLDSTGQTAAWSC
jgi:hypothetical protein